MKNLLLPLLLVACDDPDPAVGATDSTPAAAPMPFEAVDLAGGWVSGCVDPGTGQALSLDFELTTETWSLEYRTYGDASCDTPFLTVHIEGPYELGERSVEVEDAREAEFLFAAKSVTPHSQDAADFLASTYGCDRPGFAVGEAADLAAGCPALGQYPVSGCDRDYDLVLLDGDVLHFGERPPDNDMCTSDKRPTQASSLGLIRPE